MIKKCKAEKKAEITEKEAEIAKLKMEHKKEIDANRHDFAKRFEECKKYYHNRIEDLKGCEKAQVAKEFSLMEKLNQVLQTSMTEKESKIKEQKNEIDRTKHELNMSRKENQSLRNKNRVLYQVGFHIGYTISDY